MQNKAIRAALALLLTLTVLCSGALAADSVVTIAKRTMSSPGDVISQKTADAYNGTFVLFNCGDYAPAYWVKQGKAYAVNGIAFNASPGIDKAPPSIKWSVLEKALAGKAPATVPAFAVSPEKLMEYINDGMTYRKAPAFKKETYFSYTLSSNDSLVGMVTMKEVGGEVAEAHLEIGQKNKELMKNAMLSFLQVVTATNDLERIKQTFTALNAAWKTPGKEISATLDGVKYTYILKGDYRNMSVIPVAQ